MRLNCESASQALDDFIKDNFSRAARQAAVIGLSGGLDSALAAALAVRALGPDSVKAFAMPYRMSSPQSLNLARLVAEKLGIALEVIDISPMIDIYFKNYPEADELRRGNKMARERMSVLYDMSARLDGLVIGTSNRSELLLGYGTMHGDLAAAMNPIGCLFKTQVRELAAHLGLPSDVIARPPSADLWHGQTDEGDFGFTYEEADQVLYRHFDRTEDWDDLAKAFSPRLITSIRRLHDASLFKRNPMPVAELPAGTVLE